VTVDDKSKVLNAPNPGLTATITGFVDGETLETSGVTGDPSLTTTAEQASPIGTYPIAVTVGSLAATNYSFTFVDGSLDINYGSGTCLGSPGRTVLQPINVDGSSVFKKNSTAPIKFRVCDANGASIGTPGVVAGFTLLGKFKGIEPSAELEPILSTTPDTAFRWSATDQQWIFNLSTKNLTAGYTYKYLITLNDGSSIEFQFAVK
jgi:hypothetical protein